MKLAKIARIAGKGIVCCGAYAAGTAVLGLAAFGTPMLVNRLTGASANPKLWKTGLALATEYAVCGLAIPVCGLMVYPATAWLVDEIMSE